jgi:hypothetical protein
VQAKHYRWLRPLLDGEVYDVASVRAHLLAVTGGTATRGVNLYFTGTAAVRALYGAGAARPRRWGRTRPSWSPLSAPPPRRTPTSPGA